MLYTVNFSVISIGESDKTIVLDEKNLNVNNIKIKQEQKAKDEASQTQIGRVNVNER